VPVVLLHRAPSRRWCEARRMFPKMAAASFLNTPRH